MAPASEPWSVKLTAGISSSAARETRSGIRHAPSRIEYSEWTWRWTNGATGIGGTDRVQPGPDGPPRPRPRVTRSRPRRLLRRRGLRLDHRRRPAGRLPAGAGNVRGDAPRP